MPMRHAIRRCFKALSAAQIRSPSRRADSPMGQTEAAEHPWALLSVRIAASMHGGGGGEVDEKSVWIR